VIIPHALSVGNHGPRQAMSRREAYTLCPGLLSKSDGNSCDKYLADIFGVAEQGIASQGLNQSLNQSLNRGRNQDPNQGLAQAINQGINQCIKRSMDQGIDQPTQTDF